MQNVYYMNFIEIVVKYESPDFALFAHADILRYLLRYSPSFSTAVDIQGKTVHDYIITDEEEDASQVVYVPCCCGLEHLFHRIPRSRRAANCIAVFLLPRRCDGKDHLLAHFVLWCGFRTHTDDRQLLVGKISLQCLGTQLLKEF